MSNISCVLHTPSLSGTENGTSLSSILENLCSRNNGSTNHAEEINKIVEQSTAYVNDVIKKISDYWISVEDKLKSDPTSSILSFMSDAEKKSYHEMYDNIVRVVDEFLEVINIEYVKKNPVGIGGVNKIPFNRAYENMQKEIAEQQKHIQEFIGRIQKEMSDGNINRVSAGMHSVLDNSSEVNDTQKYLCSITDTLARCEQKSADFWKTSAECHQIIVDHRVKWNRDRAAHKFKLFAEQRQKYIEKHASKKIMPINILKSVARVDTAMNNILQAYPDFQQEFLDKWIAEGELDMVPGMHKEYTWKIKRIPNHPCTAIIFPLTTRYDDPPFIHEWYDFDNDPGWKNYCSSPPNDQSDYTRQWVYEVYGPKKT